MRCLTVMAIKTGADYNGSPKLEKRCKRVPLFGKLRNFRLESIFAFCENVFVRLISRKALKTFWQSHKDAENALKFWATAVQRAAWKNFTDVKRTFNTADQYRHLTIFDIGGNKYRLIAAIHYNTQMVYVRHVLTHKEYDLGKWKTG